MFYLYMCVYVRIYIVCIYRCVCVCEYIYRIYIYRYRYRQRNRKTNKKIIKRGKSNFSTPVPTLMKNIDLNGFIYTQTHNRITQKSKQNTLYICKQKI